MSIQTIINRATQISINRRKTVGIQYTRSQIARVSETPTRVPWRFDVDVQALFPYSTVREVIEELDKKDRTTPEQISFSANAKLSSIFAYRGSATQTELGNLTVYSFAGNSLVIDNLTTIPFGTTVFKKGDYIQIADYPYPFTATQDVSRGIGGTITVPVHRANFMDPDEDPVVDKNIVVGNAVSFYMLCVNMPTYTLVPGGGEIYIKFDSSFQLYEHTGSIV